MIDNDRPGWNDCHFPYCTRLQTSQPQTRAPWCDEHNPRWKQKDPPATE